MHGAATRHFSRLCSSLKERKIPARAPAASRRARPRRPAPWYYNLRAHPTATVTVGGVSRRVRAREAIGDERDRLWQRDPEIYPGRAAYERRAANRRIPVVVLAPVSGQDHPVAP